MENFKIRTVLTAHPTQFYPGSVLGIITDLTEAIRENNLNSIKQNFKHKFWKRLVQIGLIFSGKLVLQSLKSR